MTAHTTTPDELQPHHDAFAQAALDRVGSVLNDTWRLESVLGVGGSAAVYVATDRNGRRAAIKLLHAEYAFHDELRARLSHEARVLALVDHPGAVRVLDHDITKDGTLFLVMELLEGETLSSYVVRKEGRIEPEQALLITLLVLDALAPTHASGVVHRDITVDNVFITRRGEVKLIDFGIALLSNAPEVAAQPSIGQVVGTPGFMAPEQAQGLNREVGVQSDVWAVGAILFELLTGVPVHFEAHTLVQKLTSGAYRAAPELGSILEDASLALQGLVDKALAFDKSDRWQDANAMREALLDLFVAAPELAGVRALDISFAPAPVGDGARSLRGTALGYERRPVPLERARQALSSFLVALSAALSRAFAAARSELQRRLGERRKRSRLLSRTSSA